MADTDPFATLAETDRTTLREWVEDDLIDILGLPQLVDVLRVICDQKTAASVYTAYSRLTSQPIHGYRMPPTAPAYDLDTPPLAACLDALDIPYTATTTKNWWEVDGAAQTYTDSRGRDLHPVREYDYWIAHDADRLELAPVDAHHDVRHEVGEFLGYPDAAVEAFVTDDTIRPVSRTGLKAVYEEADPLLNVLTLASSPPYRPAPTVASHRAAYREAKQVERFCEACDEEFDVAQSFVSQHDAPLTDHFHRFDSLPVVGWLAWYQFRRTVDQSFADLADAIRRYVLTRS